MVRPSRRGRLRALLSSETTTGVDDGDNVDWDDGGIFNPGTGGTTITTKDEGSTLSTTVTTIDFVGAGVTATGGGATTTVTIPGGGGSLPWYVVTDATYGAVGDDSTDDTTAIQDAIDAAAAAGGGIVYFPAGTYKITASLTISTAHIHLLGEGNEYGPSIIHMTTANTTAVDLSASWADDSWTYHGTIRGLLIIGPGTSGSPATSGQGVYARSHVDLYNVGIVGFYDGLYWDDRTYYSKAIDCFISSCAHAGVVMNNTNNLTLERCRIFGDDGRTAPTVAGRRIFGPMQYGVRIIGASWWGNGHRVLNSTVEYFTKDGVYMTGVHATTIAGTYFESPQATTGFAYINANSSTATVIHGNYFEGDGVSGFYAIAMNSVAGMSILSNLFGNVGTIGVTNSGTNTGVIEGANDFDGSPTNSWPTGTVHLDLALTDPMTTRGDVIVRNSSNATARLAVGSSGTVLASNGTDPAWTAPGGDISGAIGAVTVGKVNGIAITGTPAVGYVPTATSTSAATWQAPAATAGTGGQILISDTPAGSPLVFADLLQNEAGTDLIYADS